MNEQSILFHQYLTKDWLKLSFHEMKKTNINVNS